MLARLVLHGAPDSNVTDWFGENEVYVPVMWCECRNLGRALPGKRKVEGIRTKLTGKESTKIKDMFHCTTKGCFFSCSSHYGLSRHKFFTQNKRKICSVVLRKGVSFLVASTMD